MSLLCMSWKQIFGNFEHQKDDAFTEQQRKQVVAKVGRAQKTLQTVIDKRVATITALEAEIVPVFMQYRKLAADGRTAAAAKRLFKEKIAPLEKRLAFEERELKTNRMVYDISNRTQIKDTSGDANSAVLRAMKEALPYIGQKSGQTLDGDEAEDIVDSITEAQMQMAGSDSTLTHSLSANLARLNNEDAIDDEQAAGADDAGGRSEESILARLNERFMLDEPAAPAPAPSSSSTTTTATTRVNPQPSAAVAPSVYRGETPLNFPSPSTAEPRGRAAATSGRQAVATAVDTGAKQRTRHVTFDTDD